MARKQKQRIAIMQYAVSLTFLFALIIFYRFPAWKCDIPAIIQLPDSHSDIFDKSQYLAYSKTSLYPYSVPNISLFLPFWEYRYFHHPHIVESVLSIQSVIFVFRYYSPSVCLQIQFSYQNA